MKNSMPIVFAMRNIVFWTACFFEMIGIDLVKSPITKTNPARSSSLFNSFFMPKYPTSRDSAAPTV